MKLNYSRKKKNERKPEEKFHNFQYYQKPEFKYEALSDSEGLRKAYEHGDYYMHGKTLYIAGSHTQRDWWDDFTKIPFWGDLKNSERYQKVVEAFKNRGEIDTVVGHSLGGSVALEIQSNFKDRITKSRTYGAPVFNLLGSDSENAERYRHWLDPFSILDRSAKKTVKWNPFDSYSFTHDYNDLGDDKVSMERIPIEEEDESGYF